MEELFTLLLQHLSEKLPAFSLIDEDYGQLETDSDTYPVTFPCVLIGNLEGDWHSIGKHNEQKGTIVLSAKAAIDCYDDTHIGSGTEQRTEQRQRQANSLYKALQGFCPLPNDMTPLSRVKSRYYPLPGGIKVYEYIFQFRVQDTSACEA